MWSQGHIPELLHSGQMTSAWTAKINLRNLGGFQRQLNIRK